MLVQNSLVRFNGLATDVYEGAREKVSNLISHSKKISALMMAGKIFTFVLVFSFIPLGTIPTRHTYDTTVRLEQNNPFVLSSSVKTTPIILGESNVDRTEREKREAEAASLATQIAKASAPANQVVFYNDPSDFDQIYMAAQNQFGVPWQVLKAVHYAESGCAGSDYGKRSSAGAQGPMQFMPGTWRAYGVDGNGDGAVDVHNVVDAIFGAAHLLAAGGAAEGNVDAALFNYNHAQWYVNKVKEIAYSIGWSR